MNEETETILDDLRHEWMSIVDEEGHGGPVEEPPKPAPDGLRGPGRPGWTDDLFREHWLEAWHATKPPRSSPMVAANFRQLNGSLGTDPDHLRKMYKEHGSPTPE
jgi:hypothetical protein